MPEELIYSDSAITGQESGNTKRFGFKRFLEDWDRGKFCAVIVDEISRLGRDNLGLAILQDKIEKSGVRLLSTDGMDTSLQGWQLNFGFRGVIASHATRETSHRVIRAMIGQLERGFMIAAPPFGYRLKRTENDTGTYWIIEKSEAILVKDIFMRRYHGSSYAAIALSLNQRGIQSPRPSKFVGAHRYWRPATVRQLLQNTIYRGVFVWNGSAFAKAKAKKNHKELDSTEYLRPDLRLIDDAVWYECNKIKTQNKVRGGGKNIFSGIITCGTCNAVLTVATGGSTPSAYCAQCSQAKRVGVPGRVSHYISINSVKAVLLHTMAQLFSGTVIDEFRLLLKQRLIGGAAGKIVELKREISQKERAIARFLDLLGSAEVDDPILTKNYKETAFEKARLMNLLNDAEASFRLQDKESIERQLSENPVNLLPKLFEGLLSTEKVRVVLKRIFPVIKLVGKPQPFTAVFYIEVAPGAIFAEVSNTNVIEEKTVQMQLSVVGGPTRPSRWIVSDLK